jgi:hypothetical protein
VAPPPPPASPAPQALVYDPQQFPAIRGEVDRLTLTARGDIDGFILKDGTEVKTAPDLSTQIAFAIKPGDRVTVHGLKAAALPLVSAVSVTDEATHRTVTDSGASAPMNPPSPAPTRHGGPPQPPGAGSETTGRVRMTLHGPQGEVNGVLLDSGTVLRFPPDQGAPLSALIEPRQTVVAEGTAITNAWAPWSRFSRSGLRALNWWRWDRPRALSMIEARQDRAGVRRLRQMAHHNHRLRALHQGRPRRRRPHRRGHRQRRVIPGQTPDQRASARGVRNVKPPGVASLLAGGVTFDHIRAQISEFLQVVRKLSTHRAFQGAGRRAPRRQQERNLEQSV